MTDAKTEGLVKHMHPILGEAMREVRKLREIGGGHPWPGDPERILTIYGNLMHLLDQAQRTLDNRLPSQRNWDGEDPPLSWYGVEAD